MIVNLDIGLVTFLQLARTIYVAKLSGLSNDSITDDLGTNWTGYVEQLKRAKASWNDSININSSRKCSHLKYETDIIRNGSIEQKPVVGIGRA